MNRLLLILLLLPVTSMAKDYTTLSGQVSRIEHFKDEGKKAVRVHFKGSDFNLGIRLNNIPKKHHSLILNAKPNKDIIVFEAEKKWVELLKEKVKGGVRADCSEFKMNIDELTELANSDQVNGINDFLTSLPKGTFQSFTLITNSHSLQKGVGAGETSPMNPRILRSSIDGKINFSWVCDPRSQAYNQVEVIYWNDKINQFKTVSYDLGKKGMKQRTHHNQTSCIGCHSYGDVNGEKNLKLNWPEYFAWSDCDENRGISMYGSFDDKMGNDTIDSNGEIIGHRKRAHSSRYRNPNKCTEQEDAAMHTRERANFKAWKEANKNNPCVNSLPWAQIPKGKEETSKYRFYPYAADSQAVNPFSLEQDYRVRTNTRFTDVYGHLMAKRNFHAVKNSPNYEQMKYYLAMEAANCLTKGDRKKIDGILGTGDLISNLSKNKNNLYTGGYLHYSGLEKDKKISSRGNPRATHPILYTVGKEAGMKPGDWSMEYNTPNDPSYNPAIFRGTEGGDHAIADISAGFLIEDLSNENQKVKKASENSMTNGITDVFGEDFSCIDDMGRGLKPSIVDQGNNGNLCRVLRIENDKHLVQLKKKLLCDKKETEEVLEKQNPIDYMNEFKSQIDKVMQEVTKESIRRGEKLVNDPKKGKCIQCHSEKHKETLIPLPGDMLFVPRKGASSIDKERAVAILNARMKEGDFYDYLNKRVNNGEMPLIGPNDINKTDREDILNYFTSLIETN